MNKTTVINYSKNGARHAAHMRGLWSREAIRAIVERYNWRMVSAAHVTRRGDDLREPIRYAIINTGGDHV